MIQRKKIYILSLLLLCSGHLGIHFRPVSHSHSVTAIPYRWITFGYPVHTSAVIACTIPGNVEVGYKVVAEKNEEGDDDFSFVEKITAVRQPFGTLCYQMMRICTAEKIRKFRDQYLHFSPGLYLIFRVLRI
jgi:hypothetical protein